MKASAGSNSSRSATTDRALTAADGGLSLDDGETSTAASARSLQCKEALLSSSDTDDGEAPYSKLVIDLDASGGPTESAPVDAKQSTPGTTVADTTAPMSALSSATSRPDGAKSRAQNSTVDGAKTVSSGHRSSKPHSAELSNGAQKGLKMKIRCSQSGGRHEVSHFHPVVGSPPPPPAAAGSAPDRSGTAAGHASKAAGQEKARSAGSHRRDRQLAKDRAKDRTPSDKHQTAGSADHAAGVTGPAALVVVPRDVSLDSSKSTNIDGVDRDGTSASLPPVPHDPYEFNASSEDSISCPTKKMKFEQVRCVLWRTAPFLLTSALYKSCLLTYKWLLP